MKKDRIGAEYFSIHYALTLLITLCLGLLLFSAEAKAVTATVAPYSRIDLTTKKEVVVDEHAIWLENEHLKLAIITKAPHSGQVFSLVFKPTGQELGNPMTMQGYWQDRGTPGDVTEAQDEIVSQSDNQAQARVIYTQTGIENGNKTILRHTKTFTLKKGASYLLVDWKQENLGTERIFYSPWIKHVGGMGSNFLNGPAKIVRPKGLTNLEWDDASPVVNWIARVSSESNSESLPMVTSMTDYRFIFRQNAWMKSPRYSLETTLARVDLQPGQSFNLPTVLLASSNLGQVGYVAPELAASLEIASEIKAGLETTLKVNVAGGLDLGERRIEGQICSDAGEVITRLGPVQLNLQAGKICFTTYPFTPVRDGVYCINLTVLDDHQQPIKLGAEVNSQKPYITLPFVVGTPPAVVVQNWQSDGKSFPSRKERRVKPWRTLINNATLQAGQVLVPDRVFPEDKFEYDTQSQSATIRMAGGEYECLQFVVDLPEKVDPLTLTVTASPLQNQQGVALEKVQLREQIYLTTSIPSDYMDFPVGQWPDPLFETDWPTKIPDAPITRQNIDVLRKCHKRVYWVTVLAQPGAAGDVYRGKINLALAGKPAGEIPVEIKVDSFTLPRRANFRCSTGMVGWQGLKSNLTILGLPAEEINNLDKNAMDSYWRQIFEYGWTPTMFFGPARVWEQYKEVGRGASVYPSSGSKKDEEWLINNNLLKYSFTYAPYDEHPDGAVPEVAAWSKKWKAEHKTPVLDCYYGSKVEPLFGLVDVWLGQSPKSAWWGIPTPPLGWGDKAIERKKAGDQFFSCNASLIWHVEFVPAQGRAEFWDDYTSGMDGRYVYSTCRWTTDVYKKNWTTGNYMGCVVYPGPHGFATSIRLETLRDGVEDYDYLSLLREAVNRAGAAGSFASAVREALVILNDAKLSTKVKDAESLNAMRNHIADLLQQLTEPAAAK